MIVFNRKGYACIINKGGRFHRVAVSGLHFYNPFTMTPMPKVNISRRSKCIELEKAQTRDGSFFYVVCKIDYRVIDLTLLPSGNPDDTFKNVALSVMHERVASRTKSAMLGLLSLVPEQSVCQKRVLRYRKDFNSELCEALNDTASRLGIFVHEARLVGLHQMMPTEISAAHKQIGADENKRTHLAILISTLTAVTETM